MHFVPWGTEQFFGGWGVFLLKHGAFKYKYLKDLKVLYKEQAIVSAVTG